MIEGVIQIETIKNNRLTIKKAELVEVIRTESVEGSGIEDDPVRTVVRHWEKNGKLIGEKIQ